MFIAKTCVASPESVEDVPGILCDVVRDGDVVIAQGAGNIGALARELSTMDFSEVGDE